MTRIFGLLDMKGIKYQIFHKSKQKSFSNQNRELKKKRVNKTKIKANKLFKVKNLAFKNNII